MRKTIASILRKTHPKEMAEFDKAPWNYEIFSPLNLDEDEAKLTVYLWVGKKKARKKYKIEISIGS